EDFCIVKNVSRHTLFLILQDLELCKKVQLRRYDSDEETLYLYVRTVWHERLTSCLITTIHDYLPLHPPRRGNGGRDFQMPSPPLHHCEPNMVCTYDGLNKTNQAFGDAFCPTDADDVRKLYRHGDLGSADVEWAPHGRPVIAGKGDWPTMVIEVASMPIAAGHLGAKGDWWFKASDHAVKIVLLVEVDYKLQALLLEHWEEDNEFMPDNAIRYRTVRRNTICLNIIQRGQDQVPFSLEGAPLLLEFEKLFGRVPVDPQDRDVRIELPNFLPLIKLLCACAIPPEFARGNVTPPIHPHYNHRRRVMGSWFTSN
ncbi:hypothetical protein V8F20_011241, partial [Naviculisporaceae sp. PSN 640]